LCKAFPFEWGWWHCAGGRYTPHRVASTRAAAIACPDRPVIAFQADGSALYTLQSIGHGSAAVARSAKREPQQPL
jgi:hypothetical protein